MFVYTVRSSSLKFFAAIALSLATLLTLIILIPTFDSGAVETDGSLSYSNVKTNDDRIAFLSQFGWEVGATPVLEETVTIPSEFDTVFTAYNELQKSQGLDLAKYKRKNVSHIRYEVKNCTEAAGTVYANLLVYRSRVIGGDISTADMNGFVRGFSGKQAD